MGMQQTGKAYDIENCHWGDCTVDDASSCPTKDWCPFNWYRTSGDSDNGLGTWYGNMQTTIRFQSWEAPVSQPGCWAYPDMLQVGRLGCSSHTQGCPVAPGVGWPPRLTREDLRPNHTGLPALSAARHCGGW